jgi:hypothetical protein
MALGIVDVSEVHSATIFSFEMCKASQCSGVHRFASTFPQEKGRGWCSLCAIKDARHINVFKAALFRAIDVTETVGTLISKRSRTRLLDENSAAYTTLCI